MVPTPTCEIEMDLSGSYRDLAELTERLSARQRRQVATWCPGHQLIDFFADQHGIREVITCDEDATEFHLRWTRRNLRVSTVMRETA